MLRTNASRILLPIVRNAVQKRSQSVISGPPTKHVPKGELYLMGTAIVILPLIIPTYVTFHIRDYRDK